MHNISVIIPTYNEEKYLPKLLDSLKNQTFKDFEIIVINNNSTDKTAKIAKQFTDKVYLCKKQGISASRNLGAKYADGKILCFIDADAKVSKNWMDKVNIAFRHDNKLDAISGFIIFPHKNPIKFLLYNLYNMIVFSGLFLGITFGKYFISGNNFAIKKKLFFDAGCFPNTLAEDIGFSSRLRKFSHLKVRFNPSMVIFYSPRRFEKNGFFRTLSLWIVSSFRKVPEINYKEDY